MQDPTIFQARVQMCQASSSFQVCQVYDRQVKVMSSMGDPQLVVLGADLMPDTTFKPYHQLCVLGKCFQMFVLLRP